MFRLCSLCILFTVLRASSLWSQQVDFDQVVQPLEAKARDFSEYLVQLAWQNHPESAIAYEEVANARDNGKNLRREWMRDAGATFNLNEGNIRATDTSQNIFFPRYNFGFNLNIFNIVSQPTKNKIAKHNVAIAEYKVNQRKLEIRAETLQRYAMFRMAKEIFRTRTLAEQETQNGFILMEQLYKTDEKNLDDYTNAAAAYFQAKENRIRADAEVMTTKYKLEELIGIRWEQIQHPAKED